VTTETEQKTEIAKTDKPKQALTIRDHLESESFQKQLATVIPRHCDAERMARIAIMAMNRTPKLKECDQSSFFKCLLDLSMWGLEPDGRRAHLIPFENRKLGIVECQLIIDYKGLVELAMRSGDIASIHADCVCENDMFKVNLGKVVEHSIDYRKPRGAVHAFWAVVEFKDGGQKFEVMTRDEVEAIRQRSRAGNSGPWMTDYNEMGKKTVFRRLTKWIPLSAEIRDAYDRDSDELAISADSLKRVTLQKVDLPAITGPAE